MNHFYNKETTFYFLKNPDFWYSSLRQGGRKTGTYQGKLKTGPAKWPAQQAGAGKKRQPLWDKGSKKKAEWTTGTSVREKDVLGGKGGVERAWRETGAGSHNNTYGVNRQEFTYLT